MASFVSRAGLKLDHAMSAFNIDATNLICADFGCNAGGFTDCLLQRGATRVYAIDTGYGALEWKLRTNPRVVPMERTNAMHVELPECVNLVVIDVAWTKQSKILPAAKRALTPEGQIVTLIKPHYEADPKLLQRGILPAEKLDAVIEDVRRQIAEAGFDCLAVVASPILGGKGNTEVLAHLRRSDQQPSKPKPVEQAC